MLANRSTYEATNIAYQAIAEEFFNRSRQVAHFDAFCQRGTTDSVINVKDVIESMPTLREWIGEKEYADVRYSSVVTRVKSYEKSFREKRLLIEQGLRDGSLTQRIQQNFGSVIDADYDALVTAYMLSNPTCYDGTALFNASHPRGPSGATQSNYSTTAFSGTQHDAVMVAMASLRDVNGVSWKIQPDTLMVGPSLARLAKEVTGSKVRTFAISAAGVEATSSVVAATNGDNWRGGMLFGGGDLTVIVNPAFVGTHAAKYLYLSTMGNARPVSLDVYKKPRAVALTQLTDGPRFNLDEFRYSLEVDLCMSPGAWQSAYLGAP